MTLMKTYRFAIAAIVASMLSGCYSIQTASSSDLSNCRLAAEDGVPVAHMFVQNKGWFLFDRIPLVCGNANTDSWFPWTFFKDEVCMEYVQKSIVRRAEARGERIIQMNAINNNVTLMQLPGTQGLSVPYIICHHETQISALFVKDKDKVEEKKPAAPVAPVKPVGKGATR